MRWIAANTSSDLRSAVGRKRKPVTQRKMAVLSARVDFAVYKRINAIAKSEDGTMTQILCAALREYIERHKR